MLIKSFVSAVLLSTLTEVHGFNSNTDPTAPPIPAPSNDQPNVDPFDDSPQIPANDAAITNQDPNMHCTTGNEFACNVKNGFWDVYKCTCTFAPVEHADHAEGADQFIDQREIAKIEKEYEEEAEEIDEIMHDFKGNRRISKKFGKMAITNTIISGLSVVWMWYAGNISFGNGKRCKKAEDKEKCKKERKAERRANNRGDNNWAAAGLSALYFWSTSFTLWLLYLKIDIFEYVFRIWLRYSWLIGGIVAAAYIAIPFTKTESFEDDTAVWAVTTILYLMSYIYMVIYSWRMAKYIDGEDILREIDEMEAKGDWEEYSDQPKDKDDADEPYF